MFSSWRGSSSSALLNTKDSDEPWATFSVSGSGVTNEPGWGTYTVQLSSSAIHLLTADRTDQIAVLPLVDYGFRRLLGVPDGAGSIQLEPAATSQGHSKGSAWLRFQTASGPEGQRSRDLDLWHEDLWSRKALAVEEAARATHQLLQSSLGDEAGSAEAAAPAASSAQSLSVGAAVEYANGERSAWTKGTLKAIEPGPNGRGQCYVVKLTRDDGLAHEVRTVAARLRAARSGSDKSPAPRTSADLDEMNRTLSLRLGKERGMSGAEQQSLEEKIIAAAMCVKGAALTKFVIGRRKRHERHVRVTGVGKSAMLKWGDNNSGRLLRAEESLTLGQRREQRLSDEEFSRCFQVVLDGKVVALMAETRNDKLKWVAGLNAIVAGLLPGRPVPVS